MTSEELLPETTAESAIVAVTVGTPLVDVREQHEWDAGHAPSAIFLPMSELSSRLDELPDGEFLVMCHSGARSARVTEVLVEQGYSPVNVAGGILAWHAAGGDVVPSASV